VPQGPQAEPQSRARTLLLLGTAAVVLSCAYVGWVFWSRRQSERTLEERAASEKRAQASTTFEGMGGNRFDILAFYASPGVIHRGDSATLCYSVSNAKAVTLEPQSERVWPSYERCVSVSPRKTTTYTLTATDAAGHTKSAAVTVEVR